MHSYPEVGIIGYFGYAYRMATRAGFCILINLIYALIITTKMKSRIK